MIQESPNNKITVMNLIASTALGGAERVLVTFASRINLSRFNIRFCLFRDKRKPEVGLLSVLRDKRWEMDSVEIRQFRELYEICSKRHVDILHTHGYRSDILGFGAAKLLGIPIVSTVHGWTSVTRRMRVYEYIQRRCLKYFDKVITVSEDLRQRLESFGVRSEKIVKFNNAIDIHKNAEVGITRSFRQELGIGPGTRLIGTVGRLSVEKGLGYFLKAGARIVARDPSVKLVLVGEGPQRKELEALAASLGISDSVIFCGYRADAERIYPALDVFVLPSLTEGIPMALLEAMAFSRPVIASRVGGVPEVVQDGVTGIFVEPKDVDELAEKMWDLLCHPEVSVQLGIRARKRVQSHFDSHEWIKKIEELYIDLALRKTYGVVSPLAGIR